jgi:hypothetical protein
MLPFPGSDRFPKSKNKIARHTKEPPKSGQYSFTEKKVNQEFYQFCEVQRFRFLQKIVKK